MYTMEYRSALKTLSLATKWVELEDIMLSKITHTHKNKYHMLSLMCGC
jgi:hypothetical protein